MTTPATKTFALDLAERAVSTFIQAGLAAAALVLVGANTGNVVHLGFWQQTGSVALAAGVGAVASLIKGVFAASLTGTASASKTVAETAVLPDGSVVDPAVPVVEPAAPSVVVVNSPASDAEAFTPPADDPLTAALESPDTDSSPSADKPTPTDPQS